MGWCNHFVMLLFYLSFTIVWSLPQSSWAQQQQQQQRSPYSLQAAVEELHHREAAKYPLNAPPAQQHYYGGGGGGFGGVGEQDYWDDDAYASSARSSSIFPATTTTSTNMNNRNRHKLNKALSKYLERENYNADDNDNLGLGPFGTHEFDEESNNLFPVFTDEKKRSSYFRERDDKFDTMPTSVFRERESQSPPNLGGGGPEHSELTEQFLREIEEAQEHEREERYKEALRHLWEKYQQQENEIESDLFEEKKRFRVPPYYMLMQKKRSYPVLPWLPYSADRKKRFPVAKRSTKRSAIDLDNLSKTDDKVAKELGELFGETGDGIQKRSIDDQTKSPATTANPNASSLPVDDMRLEGPDKRENGSETASVGKPSVSHHQHEHDHDRQHEHAGHVHAHGHAEKEHQHRKRSDHPSHDSHEDDEDEDEDEGDEHEDEHDDEHEGEEDSDEEYDDERKKKRDTSNVKHDIGELFKGQHQSRTIRDESQNNRRKKSIEWSKYFGIDRKKKVMRSDDLNMKKRSAVSVDSVDEEKKKRNIDPVKLDSMDRKLQSIEDFIIDETIKYTGAHEGISNPEDIRRLKDHVLSRLATAYSLEKMRRSLDKLRQSVDNDNHLIRNIIEPEEENALDNDKRLSTKKDKANDHLTAAEKTKEINSIAMMGSANDKAVDNAPTSDGDNDMKYKKKRNGYLRYPDIANDFSDIADDLSGPARYEALNDAYLGNKNYIVGSNQCPIIESMAERCRGVDLLSGDLNQDLLPICGVHQICYLCGTSQVSCDYRYLAEADAICSNNNNCQAAARSVLMILRGTPGPQLGPRECLKNSCLYNAMREIGL